MSCANKTITSGFTFVCNRTPKKGIVQNVRLINKSDIDYSATVFGTNPLVIESIVLNSGKSAFDFEGVKTLMNAKWNVVEKENAFDKVSHEVMVYCSDISPTTKTEIQSMINDSELVAIVENKERGVAGENAYEVYGYENGLVLAKDTAFDANEDGGLPMTLRSVEDMEENVVPYTFFKTDYDATKVLVDAL